jgi:hypothetical protein
MPQSSTKSTIKSTSQNRTLILGIATGVLATLVIAAAAYTVYIYANRPVPSAITGAPTWKVSLADPTEDLLDKDGKQVANAPAYLDITAAEIRVGDAGILTGEYSTGVVAKSKENEQTPAPSLIALLTISMAGKIPQPKEQDNPFALGVAIDRDSDPTNNDMQTPNLAGTDTTIGITCDPQRGKCLEAIALFDGKNWDMKATEVTWKIDGNQIKLAFPLDFLPSKPPSNINGASWRVFASIIDAKVGGPVATDVVPEPNVALAKVVEVK